VLMGLAIGLAAAAAVGFLWVRIGKGVDLRAILSVSAVFLSIFLVQLVLYGVHELAEARRVTLAGLASRDDEWLEQPLRAAPAMNAHWAWFHVAEDEINHRGQIRWLRSRLPSASR